jgi:hypothetical protein
VTAVNPAPDRVLEAHDAHAGWLAEHLVAAGLAPAGSRVARLDAVEIGAGKVGANVRFTLEWDPPGAGPTTVVGKFPATDPASRMAGAALGNYEREVRFYRDLVQTVEVRAPRCWATDLDVATGGFSLLLADLAPAEVGDQLDGCSIDDARAALDALVGLHAPRWGDPRLADHADWLGPRLVGGGEIIAQLILGVLPSFSSRYADALPGHVHDVVARLAPVIGRWAAPIDGPVTVTHNDYRLDNLLFDRRADPPVVWVVDWQTVGVGPGIADVAYLLGAGLDRDLRRAHERELVAHYGDALRSSGVPVDDDELWLGYRRTAPAGLVMAILASSVVGADERSDAMFCAMAQRHAEQMLDVGSLDLL